MVDHRVTHTRRCPLASGEREEDTTGQYDEEGKDEEEKEEEVW